MTAAIDNLRAQLDIIVNKYQVPRAFAQQGYPSRNIRVVVPTAQGGSADRLARVFDDFAGTVAPDWRQVAVAGRFGRDE